MSQTFNLDNAKAIDGWMSDRELEWLAKTANKSRKILEIGSYKGRSTVAMLDNSTAIVACVDPFDGIYFDKDSNPVNYIRRDAYDDFVKNISKHHDRVIVYRCRSENLRLSTIRFDFIFIDGDHRYNAAQHDIKLAERLIQQGGIIAGHDYDRRDWPGVTKAVNEYYGENGFQRVDSIWIVQK